MTESKESISKPRSARWQYIEPPGGPITVPASGKQAKPPVSADPEVQKLIDRCYDPNPGVRVAGILTLARVGLVAYKTQLVGKTVVAGKMLGAMQWREQDAGSGQG